MNRIHALVAIALTLALTATASQAVDVHLAASREQLDSARLINLSARSYVGTGEQILVAGFTVVGDGNKQLLVRGIGPSLASFGVAGVISDPKLKVFASGNPMPIASSYGIWSPAAHVFASVGAFPLSPPDSRDCALLLQLSSGGYTAQISGVQLGIISRGGFVFPPSTGVGLVEIYDADTDGAYATRLSNLSARNYVEESNPLIAGFVISGNGMKNIVIRGVGPTLRMFGITGALADPKLELYQSGSTSPIATNDNWGGGASLASAFAAVGAFMLEPDSKDAALHVSLPAGGYTAHISGAGGTTGVALVEIYEAP